MTNKFQTFFEKPYEEISKALSLFVRDQYKILDIGCNNGNLEEKIDRISKGCFVHCVDIDKKVIEELKNRKYQNITVSATAQDANQFLEGTNLQALDIILINATLHEINDSSNQPEYLLWFFRKARQLLAPKRRVILGDYYYPKHVSDKDVKEYMEHQFKEINHADPRHKFVNPRLIRDTVDQLSLNIDHYNEIKAVEGIDRRYYVFAITL